MTPWRSTAIALFALNLAASSISAQNLITNGDFDTDLTGWTVTGETTAASHDALDSLGRPDSGSLLISNLVDEVFVRSVCFPVDDMLLYSIGGAIQGDLEAAAVVDWYSDASCSTSLGLGGGFSTPSGGAANFYFHYTNITPLADAQSGRALLYQNLAESNLTGSPFNRFDRMFVLVGHTFPPLQLTASAGTSDGSTYQFQVVPEGGVSPYEPIYTWDFGDGHSSDEQNPVHTYSSAGTYTAVVTANTGHDASQIGVTITALGDVTDVPTLGEIGMVALGILLIGAALFFLKR